MKRAAPALLVVAGLAAGCTEGGLSTPGDFTGTKWDIDAVAALPPNEDPFLSGLQDGYVRFAKAELAEFDWIDGAEFTARARAAAEGVTVEPFDVAERVKDGPELEALTMAQKELTGWLASTGARLRAGRQIGEAQTRFDCWVQEAQEGHQSPDIDTCREEYQLMIILVRDLGALPENMAVILPGKDGPGAGIELAQGERTVALDQPFAAAGTGETLGDVPVEEGEIRDAFAGALSAQPKPPVKFTLTFESGSTRISREAFDIIALATEEAFSRKAPDIIITGFADSVGPTGVNLALSRSRAGVVRREVIRELGGSVPDKFTVKAKAKGETGAGLGSDAVSRRVEILVR